MPTIGVSELLIIGILLLLVFGGSRLPALGEGAGRALGKLLRATKSNERIEVKNSHPDSSVSDAELIAPSPSDEENASPKT